jgi:hypothetical protein
MSRRLVLTTALLACTATIAANGEPCPKPIPDAALRQVKALQAKLLAFKLPDEIDTDVPQPLQAEIRSFKDSLVLFADASLACAAGDVKPAALESILAQALEANKPEAQEVYDEKKPPQLDRIYGTDLRIKVTVPTNMPHLLLIELGFGIECGGDFILLAYEQGDTRWERVLRWQSGDYDRIDKAFGDFFTYVVVPHDDTGQWLLAAAHGSPWCTSRWSGFDLDLLEPSQNPNAPKVLQHIEHGYVRGDIEPVMKPVAGGFQLRLETGMIDTDVMTRIGIYRYRINETHLERVQPIANNGRDFVDEWLQSPWEESGQWISAANTDGLQSAHDRISRDQHKEDAPAYTFGPVRACSGSPAQFQVELDGNWIGAGGAETPSSTTYFEIEQGKNSFTMIRASQSADARCKGPDIMAQR